MKDFLPEEIVPVTVKTRKGDTIVFDTDERPMDTNHGKNGQIKTGF
jgi:hypothetical protein